MKKRSNTKLGGREAKTNKQSKGGREENSKQALMWANKLEQIGQLDIDPVPLTVRGVGKRSLWHNINKFE